MWNEIGDTCSEIREIDREHELKNVEAIWQQVWCEWYNFERHARDEI